MEKIYHGPEKLVLCLDVGTTQSAATVIHLHPGSPPKIRVVSRWPGDDTSSKIPTFSYYSSGVPKAFGAEALDDVTKGRAVKEKWEECIYFKLWLHRALEEAPAAYQPDPQDAKSRSEPKATTSATLRNSIANFSIGKVVGGFKNSQARTPRGLGFELAPLPSGVKVEKVYADWMGYLYRCSKSWWSETNPDGAFIWEKLEGEMVFCLAHPNGWSTLEQGVLLHALSVGVHTPELDGPGSERVVFVTEGEASVHFGLHYTSAAKTESWLSVGSQLTVVDAGGSTVDISTYNVDQVTPELKLREVKLTACVQAGAIFPTRTAKSIIQRKLRNSKYGTDEYINEILHQFDIKTKCNFVGEKDADHMIKFGFDRDNDKEVGISRGRLRLTAAEVGQAFKPTTDLIMASLAEQLDGTQVKTILLSGGFGESPHLQKLLRDKYESSGIEVLTSEEPSKKAVAEGAALFYVRDAVVARAARVNFGTLLRQQAYLWPEHMLDIKKGEYKTYLCDDGITYQNGIFHTMVVKGTILESDAIISKSLATDTATAFEQTTELWVCEKSNIGDTEIVFGSNGRTLPEYKRICTIQMNLNALKTDANRRRHLNLGPDYYHITFFLELFFGGTSLKARLRWDEDGVTKTGPATVIPSAYY